jgi:hypothetical protein
MGQATVLPYEEALKDGTMAVRQWDDLLFRLAAVKDDGARGEILNWLGRADIPGSPAERYAVVRDALVAGFEPDEVFSKRVDDLVDKVSEMDTRIASAETSGTLPTPKRMGAGSTPEEGMALSKCLLGGVALLGLIVLPFVLD